MFVFKAKTKNDMILPEPLQVKNTVATQSHTFVIFFDLLVAFDSTISLYIYCRIGIEKAFGSSKRLKYAEGKP